LNDAVTKAAAGDKSIRIVSPATGQWSTNPPGMLAAIIPWPTDPPGVLAAVEVVAVDALDLGFKFDVPIRINTYTKFIPDDKSQRLKARTGLLWYAHDFITNVSGGLITAVQNKVSKKILDVLKLPTGYIEVERGKNHVVIEKSFPYPKPKTPLFSATVQYGVVDSLGFQATGEVKVLPPPVAMFTLEGQRWGRRIDCTALQYITEFHPAVVHIFCPDPYFTLRIEKDPVVDPVGFWTPSVTWSGFGPGNEVAHLTFEAPPVGPGNEVAHLTLDAPPVRAGPAGSTSSAYIETNLGVRWADLGLTPAKPAPPANQLGIQAWVITECKHITDRWGMGAMHLDWLVDPPHRKFGGLYLREWTIVVQHAVTRASTVELIAEGPSGHRSLATVPVEGGIIFAQVVTDSDETLSVRADKPLSTPQPQVMQRWIIPVTTDVEGAALSKDEASGEPTATRTAGRGRAVAVLHRGEVVRGIAGPLVSAVESVRPSRTSRTHK
jgi:hypothetical protein